MSKICSVVNTLHRRAQGKKPLLEIWRVLMFWVDDLFELLYLPAIHMQQIGLLKKQHQISNRKYFNSFIHMAVEEYF